MAKVIEIVIAPDGATTIKTQGYAGADCVKATKAIEDALGARTSEVKTAEFYNTTAQERKVGQ